MANLTKSKEDYLISGISISNLDSLSLILRMIDLSKCTRYFILSTTDGAGVAGSFTEKRSHVLSKSHCEQHGTHKEK